MKYLLLTLLLPIARLIVWDFRHRAVPIPWLWISAVGALCVSFMLNGWREVLERCWQNMSIIIYMGLGVLVWGWAKMRRLINPINVFIGLGDLLFFMALMPLFPVMRFTILLIGSMVFSLAWWWTARLRGKPTKNIPLVATSGLVIAAAIIFIVFFE